MIPGADYPLYTYGHTMSNRKKDTTMKVLLADDSALLRKNLRKLLSSVEHITGIMESDSVESTICSVNDCNPDVVILDISMPGGSGFDVLQALRQREQKPIVIVLTNYATDTNRKKSMELGALYFFDKSNEFEKAINVVRQTKPPHMIV